MYRNSTVTHTRAMPTTAPIPNKPSLTNQLGQPVSQLPVSQLSDQGLSCGSRHTVLTVMAIALLTLTSCGPSTPEGNQPANNESSSAASISSGSGNAASSAQRTSWEELGIELEKAPQGEQVVGIKLAKAQVSLDAWNQLIESNLNLQTLDVSDSPHVVDAMFEATRKLPKLRRVRLSRTKVSDVGLAHLAAATNLEQLEAQGCHHLTSIGLAYLAGLKKLKDVKLGGEMFDDSALGPISQLSGLRILGLDDTRVTNLELLVQRPDLQRLSVVRAPITPAGLAAVAQLKQLQQLRLRGTKIDDAALAAVGQCTQLKLLDLSETTIGDDGLARLAPLTQLEDLNLWKTRVTGGGLAPLSGLKSLKRLNLDDDLAVDDAGMPFLSKLEQLEFLHLGDTRITDAGLEQLAGLKRLKELILTSCPHVTRAGIDKLKQALPEAEIRE